MAAAQRIVINIPNVSSDREVKQARQIIARWLVGLTILMVYFCGMFPFDFSSSPSGNSAGAFGQIYQRFDLTLDQLGTGESRAKLIFYMPLGFALGSLLWVWRGKRTPEIILRCVIAMACAAAISASVEVLQVFLSRDPSLADIISKTIGSAVGFGLFVLVGEPVMRSLARALIAIQRVRDLRVFGAAAGVWFCLAVIAPITARNIGSLDSWDPAFPALIGNETDGVRHWDGTVSNVWLSASALNDDEIESVLAAPNPTAQLKNLPLGDSLMMAFHLNDAGPYTDSTGHTGDLVWTPNFERGATVGTNHPADLTGIQAIGRIGVPISEGWWLSTAKSGAAKASTRIAQTEAFTLVMDLAMHDLDHGNGWPRIFSISKNAGECNLQLLQDRQNLQLRIRSGASGDGGSDPELIIPGIFSDTLPHRLLVSYDHARVRVESSNSGERYELQFLPDAWLVWRVFPSSFWHYSMGSSGGSSGLIVARAIYRIAVSFPIGMMVGAILRVLRQGRKFPEAGRISIGLICGAILILEMLLHFAAATPFSIVLPIISLLAGCAGVASIERAAWATIWRSKPVYPTQRRA